MFGKFRMSYIHQSISSKFCLENILRPPFFELESRPNVQKHTTKLAQSPSPYNLAFTTSIMSQAVQYLNRFARVKATVPLEIRQSSIPVAGSGVFATEMISAQNHIFSIASPLLCIVGTHQAALESGWQI
jgi:hypothetical protein